MDEYDNVLLFDHFQNSKALHLFLVCEIFLLYLSSGDNLRIKNVSIRIVFAALHILIMVVPGSRQFGLQCIPLQQWLQMLYWWTLTSLF